MMLHSPEGSISKSRLFPVIISLAAVLFFSLGGVSYAEGQNSYASPQDAVSAFVKAMRTGDMEELAAVLGPECGDLISSGGEADDRREWKMFLADYDARNRISLEGDGYVLIVGKDEWPFPIPVVKKEDRWLFDTARGREEILNRRVGRNELDTIQTMLAIVDAQREYAREDRDGDDLLEYARKFRSDEGAKNGLYWDTKEGERPSPLGELAARARAEGYASGGSGKGPVPYHGYYYRILTAQGGNAAGGAYDYVVKDRMIGGFAVMAYPAEYGNSGVMTFIVNHDGVVFQKDLGENTEELAKVMKEYDPDGTWTPHNQ